MTFKAITYHKKDVVAYVTLNRPEKLNSYNIQMRDDLYEAFTAARDDPDVQALIISGAGKAFCVGADLSEFGASPSPTAARSIRWERDVWGTLKDLRKLTVAVLHGWVLGSGLELALLCDLRLAAEGTRFGLPETALGFIPAAGATQSLSRVAKPGTALAMILTCERFDAEEAYRRGLLHRIVPQESLMTEAEAMARGTLSAGPLAVALAKEAVNDGLDLSLEQGLRLEERLANLAYCSSDAWEGLRAHVEGRVPVFHGR